MATAKIFMHGNSQAVRLPKEFRLEGDEVDVSRVGRVLILRPKKISYADVVAAFSGFQGELKRRQDHDQEREWKGKRAR